jgi:hypothetical protein
MYVWGYARAGCWALCVNLRGFILHARSRASTWMLRMSMGPRLPQRTRMYDDNNRACFRLPTCKMYDWMVFIKKNKSYKKKQRRRPPSKIKKKRGKKLRPRNTKECHSISIALLQSIAEIECIEDTSRLSSHTSACAVANTITLTHAHMSNHSKTLTTRTHTPANLT